MILVDVSVPALDDVFDFELDEEVQVKELTEKIMRLISQVQGSKLQSREDVYLYAFRQECILNPQMTLKQQGVQGGDKLILI